MSESVLLPSPALEVKLGSSSQGETVAISGEPVQPGELGEPVQEDSESSEEAAAGLGRGPAAPAVGRQYVQAFQTKQVLSWSYLQPKATSCF